MQSTRKFRLENPWHVNYRCAVDRCTNKGHVSYKYYGGKGIRMLLTIEDVKSLWFRDKAYAMKSPTIDRIKAKSNYIFDNCRFIEACKNNARSHVERTFENYPHKKVSQSDRNGLFIRTFISAAEAEHITGIKQSAIRKVCRGEEGRTQTKGYIWAYV
jgi:hypothetical protein